jgi:cyclin C
MLGFMAITICVLEVKRLGKRLSVRQQAMATAQLYIKRFYTKIEIRRTNPYLLVATAVYLACKMEESPQHIRLVVSEARSLWPGIYIISETIAKLWLISFADYFNSDTSKLGECEFFLISEMNSQMIIHQPYRSLLALQDEFFDTQEESSLAWSVINDHYMTDLPLLYAPHILALTAILLVLVLQTNGNSGAPPTPSNGGNGLGVAAQAALKHATQARGISGTEKGPATSRTKIQRFSVWLSESTVDIEAMVDSIQEMISFYECQEQYNEKSTREQVNRFIKARNLDK